MNVQNGVCQKCFGEFHGGYCNCHLNINFESNPFEADVQKEIEKNPILKEVQDLLTTQTAKGLAKYPRTVHVDDHSLTEWIDHALQEKVDEIVYLVTIKHKIRKVIG